MARRFASPDGSRLIARVRNADLKTPLWPVWVQDLKGWPIDGFDNCSGYLQSKEIERGGSASDQHLDAQALWASWPTFESQPNAIHGFFPMEGREPSGPVEQTRELYGLTTDNLESVTSWPKLDLREQDIGGLIKKDLFPTTKNSWPYPRRIRSR